MYVGQAVERKMGRIVLRGRRKGGKRKERKAARSYGTG
jgi:hypothetical protein